MAAPLPIRRRARRLWDTASDLERRFDAMGQHSPRWMAREESLWHPTMDMHNRKEELVVELELPGVKQEDVELTVRENHLIVEGTRQHSEGFDEQEHYYSERPFGEFHRIVHLPTEVDDEKAKAHFSNGVLTVEMPKKESERGKRIEVQNG